ncbi:hypothetical protein [Actinomycetospora sp. NBRC 106375]|uniref:hypothetical protein n=1 Tax=Actinomycetospora sp. NBRC 106375 TaxID=3032207 RepID=UPI002555CB32|nr:hypothetical protein [Actinomycetospora sp. NBRC 106375]
MGERRLRLVVDELADGNEMAGHQVGEVLREAAQVAPRLGVEQVGGDVVGQRRRDRTRRGVLVPLDRPLLAR